MKKLLSAALALVLALGMFAGAVPAAAAGTTVITLVSTYAVPGFEAGLEAAHPELDLQVETIPSGVIAGEVNRRLRKDHGPDLFITNLPAGESAQYASDLSAEEFTEKYQASIMKSVAIEGVHRFLPLPGGYYGYILNKTLLDELGLALPETVADNLAILAAAKEKGVGVSAEGYGFGFSDIGATFVGAYFIGECATDFLSTAAGAKWLASFAYGEAKFGSEWESAIAFAKACVDNGYMHPDKLFANYNGRLDSNANAFKAENELPARTAILSYGNVEMYNRIRSKSNDEFVMLPCLPAESTGNKLMSAVANNYIAINQALDADEAKRNAALSVLDYLSTEEGQALWINDSDCSHSYLTGYVVDTQSLPESIRPYVESGAVFTNPFPTDLLAFMGKTLISACKGKMEMKDACKAIDDYYKYGSDDVAYDLSVVGTVAADMLYVNGNTRKEETALGNFIADAIREASGADVVLANGGSIRSSLYAGDVTGDDLSAVCPYGNLIVVSEMDGATLRAAITNGIQKTWKPAGQFLQVSGVKYTFKPAADETEVAELVSLCYADGTEVKDTDTVKVAYTNYMGGSGGYVDAGDGFTMLNVYDEATPKTVKLVSETGKTFCDALKEYFKNHSDAPVAGKLEGRIGIAG